MTIEYLLYVVALVVTVSMILFAFLDRRNLAFLDRCIILDRLKELTHETDLEIISATRSRIIFTSNGVIYEILISFQVIRIRSKSNSNKWTKYSLLEFKDFRDWIESIVKYT